MPTREGLITLEEIQEAKRNVENSDLGVIKTPLLKHVTGMFPQLPSSVDLYLKLENTQTTGIVMTHVTGMFDDICFALDQHA
jgi:hypothetical protein